MGAASKHLSRYGFARSPSNQINCVNRGNNFISLLLRIMAIAYAIISSVGTIYLIEGISCNRGNNFISLLLHIMAIAYAYFSFCNVIIYSGKSTQGHIKLFTCATRIKDFYGILQNEIEIRLNAWPHNCTYTSRLKATIYGLSNSHIILFLQKG